MRTLTEISKFQFLDMVTFFEAHKKVYGDIPKSEVFYAKFGELRTKLFLNMIIAFDRKELRLDTFKRAILRDDNMIEYKHFNRRTNGNPNHHAGS